MRSANIVSIMMKSLIRHIICGIYVILLAVSCSTTRVVEVPVEKVRVETEIGYVRDSIFVRDSIDRFIYGDTVFINKTHTKVIERCRIDTVTRCDSIPVVTEVEVVKEVNVLYWWQKLLIGMGIVAIAIIILKLK